MIWGPLKKGGTQADAIKHVACGGRVVADYPFWGKCEGCGAAWSFRRVNDWPQAEIDARFLAGYRTPETCERRVWVETGNSLHGMLVTGTDLDDREGTLPDGRRWWCYDHPYARTY